MFAGETVEITNVVTDFDGAAVLTPATISSCQVKIEDTLGNVVLTPTNMVFSTGRQLWFYTWSTAAIPAGSYIAKVTITDSSGLTNFNFVRIALRAGVF